MEAFRWGGEQLCLPQNVSSLAVYYNGDLFDAHEVPEPEAGWTWDDMVAPRGADPRRDGAGAAADDPEAPARAGRVRPRHRADHHPARPVRLVGRRRAGRRRAAPTRFALDTPEARAALAVLPRPAAGIGVCRPTRSVEAEDDESRFPERPARDVLSSRRLDADLPDDQGLRLGRGAAARAREPAGILHSDAYCMAAAADQGRGLALHRVRARRRKASAILAAYRPHRAVADRRLRSPAFLDPQPPAATRRCSWTRIPSIRRVPTISTWPESRMRPTRSSRRALRAGRPAPRSSRQLDERPGRSSRAPSAVSGRPASRASSSRTARCAALAAARPRRRRRRAARRPRPVGMRQVDAAAPRRRARGARPAAGRASAAATSPRAPPGGATWRWSSRATRCSRT